MYSWLHQLLSDKTGGTVFACFGPWHFLYLTVIFGGIIATLLLLRKGTQKQKQRAIGIAISIAFGLYMADFFLMPFAYGRIDIEKLPFHICTTMCIMCFLSRYDRHLAKWKHQLAILGLVSNIIYVLYPAGVGWYQIHPLSYRAVQTLLFHGAMTAYGIFVLAFEDVNLTWKRCYRELPLIVAMTLWALLGNTLYNASTEQYDYFFNWFFVVRDPFYLLPADISPYVMPFLMVLAIWAAVLLVYAAYFGLRKCFRK